MERQVHSSGGVQELRAWMAAVSERPVLVRSLATCLIVGSVLNAINHGEALLRGELGAGKLWQVALTFLVPFLVATISSGTAIRGQRTGHQKDRDRLLRQLAANARFADDNPNPVLRVSRAGVVEYANRASTPVMTAWNVTVGEVISQPIVADLRKAAEAPHLPGVKVRSGERTFLVRPVALDDLDVLLLYGTDGTPHARQGL